MREDKKSETWLDPHSLIPELPSRPCFPRCAAVACHLLLTTFIAVAIWKLLSAKLQEYKERMTSIGEGVKKGSHNSEWVSSVEYTSERLRNVCSEGAHSTSILIFIPQCDSRRRPSQALTSHTDARSTHWSRLVTSVPANREPNCDEVAAPVHTLTVHDNSSGSP
ncbi:hypothetical protein NL676_023909 [Syzygium grande]|nr:hypothetical protein NL676_023909 [Syzygium grande]